MHDDLKYLVHFFTDKEHLFKTITMAGANQVNGISDTIAARKGWYWIRYSQSHRNDDLARRMFVEAELYNGYIQEYGCLKGKKTNLLLPLPEHHKAKGNRTGTKTNRI